MTICSLRRKARSELADETQQVRSLRSQRARLILVSATARSLEPAAGVPYGRPARALMQHLAIVIEGVRRLVVFE